MRKIKRYIAVVLVAVLLCVCSSCSAKTVKGGEIADVFTQTRVVLSELPQGTAAYSDFFSASSPAFVIPGLYEKFIPQGMTFSPAKQLVLISGYYEDSESVSRITAVDYSTGAVAFTVGLQDANGVDFYGHSGGIACSETTVFVTCGSHAYYISLDALCSAENGSVVKFEGSITLNTLGSFASYCDGVLWVGDFIESTDSERREASNITTLPSGETLYAWCEGYKLKNGFPNKANTDSAGTGFVPDCILAIPEQVQGMTRTSDGRFVFSTSYGRKNDSVLIVCENLFADSANSTVNVAGKDVPLYIFGESTHLSTINALPMSQALSRAGNDMLLLFESGADKYRNGGGKHPTDYVFELDLGEA